MAQTTKSSLGTAQWAPPAIGPLPAHPSGRKTGKGKGIIAFHIGLVLGLGGVGTLVLVTIGRSLENVDPKTGMIILAAFIAFVILIASIRGAAPKSANTNPGWWPDPFGRHEHRYYDGKKWTDHTSDKGVSSVDPMSPLPATSPSNSTTTLG